MRPHFIFFLIIWREEEEEKVPQKREEKSKQNRKKMNLNLIQAPLSDFTHWFGDNMQKRIYEFHEGTLNDKNILGLKGTEMNIF